VVVVAMDEERHIGRCLASAAWARERIVVDSWSSDRTAAIAASMGARVIQREWSGYAAQKQFAVLQATEPWVLVLDADEEVTSELATEVQTLLAGEVGESAFSIRIPLEFMGRRLGHYGRARRDPGHVRLFWVEGARFDGRMVHEQVVVNGSIGMLRGEIRHDSYPAPALRSYWRKIQHYAELEARDRAVRGQGGHRWARAAGRLGWMLAVRGGALHGPAAWLWIAGQAYQEWLVSGRAARLRQVEGRRGLA
jgi:glycosyltransferase involved in cell wall biosynthesis